ncbi:MAG: NAD-dependent epimerase/dehydratase family protein, partial [Saprospiraceae bacterium]|nr:NAD-dependent epimerase/dehydratase family protein [Saprospiraceae bacterium]
RIGNVLVRQLLEAGHQVRVLERRKRTSLAGLPVQRIEGNINDPKSIDTLLQGCEVVYHLAAFVSISGGHHGMVEKVNVEGTRQLVSGAINHGLRRIIYFGSIHAFQTGDPELEIDENQPLAIDSSVAYNRSKAQALQFILNVRGPEIIALCPTAVIGPGDFEPSYTGQMLLMMHQGKLPLLVQGGYNWVDVRDIVQAALLALDQGQPGTAYLVSGHYASLTDLAKMVQAITGVNVTQTLAPDWLVHLGLPFVRLYATVTKSDPLYTREALLALKEGSRHISLLKVRKAFEYHPRPLEETIRDSYRWFKEHRYLP